MAETYTYLEAIGIGFPLVQCHATDAGTVYETLVWDAGNPIPPKEVLDYWIASNPVNMLVPTGVRVIPPNTTVVHLELVADKKKAALGEIINITATIKDDAGNVIPITDDFSVPVADSLGEISVIKRAAFVDGVAQTTVSFNKSGYYRVTEKDINSRLSGLYILLPGIFEVTFYEI